MAFTADLTTDVGKVRLLIPDRLSAYPIFQDDEIEAFLMVEGSVLKCAVALAIETIATDEALLLKVMKLGDNTTDGAKLAEALLKRAKLLRDQAAKAAADALAEEDDGSGYFDIAEQVFNEFGRREHLWNEMLRGG